MCLVLNKIDRLIVDLHMDSREIYWHLVQIVENVNAIIAELISGDFIQNKLERDSEVEAKPKQASDSVDVENEDEELEKAEDRFFFRPENGNVAFSSALDCWAFNLAGFSQKIAKKLGMNPRALQKLLWGEYYYFNKKVVRKPPKPESKEMFA
jgi:ribosome assembly protein 1